MRVEGHRLDGPRPPQWVLRCRAEGLKPPVKVQWRFPAGVKQIGWGVPQDEPSELVQPPENAAAWAECSATGADGVVVRATHSMVPLSVGAAPATAKPGELITVRGAGFGPSPAGSDGLWLVPFWGAALPADRCKGAAWSEAAVSACVPAAARGRTFELRVQSNEELAIAPKPLVVAP
ncbi:MAG TPA: hypothetical protein VF997_07025 [Polyangia bacterium]